MPHIAFVSPLGGTGQTTLIANLATLLSGKGVPCLAVDLCTQNGLGIHLGLQQPSRIGWASACIQGQWWADDATVNSNGVTYLPFGEVSGEELVDLHHLLEQQPEWVPEQLQELEWDVGGVVLLDAPSWPSIQARQVLGYADMIIICLDASSRACHAQSLVKSMLAQTQSSSTIGIVITDFDPRRQSQSNALQTLHQQWAEMLIPYTLHKDEGVPAAFAQSSCVSVCNPNAQSAHDMQGIANWIGQFCNVPLEVPL